MIILYLGFPPAQGRGHDGRTYGLCWRNHMIEQITWREKLAPRYFIRLDWSGHGCW